MMAATLGLRLITGYAGGRTVGMPSLACKKVDGGDRDGRPISLLTLHA